MHFAELVSLATSSRLSFAVTRYQFCLACMEQLPVQLREKVLQFQIKAAAEQIPVKILYIVSAGYDSVMTSMMGLPLKHVEPISPASFREAAQVSSEIHVCTGPAGSGKTHLMQAQLPTKSSLKQQSLQLSLNEDASAASLINSLSELDVSPDASAVVAIYISSFASIRVVNQLLFQLLVEGVVTHPDTGQIFALPPDADASFTVEVPAPVSAFVQDTSSKSTSASNGTLAASNNSLQDLPVLADCAKKVHLVDSRYDCCISSCLC